MSQPSFIFQDLDVFGAQANYCAKCPHLSSSAISLWFMSPVLVRNVTGCVLLIQCWFVPILVMLMNSKVPLPGPEGSRLACSHTASQDPQLRASTGAQETSARQERAPLPWGPAPPRQGAPVWWGLEGFRSSRPVSRRPSCPQRLLPASPSSSYSY